LGWLKASSVRCFEIDNVKSEVIGVMPERFQFPAKNSQIWEPDPFAERERREIQRGTGPWRVLGRMKPDVTVEQAQTEMSGIAGRLEQAFPNSNNGLGINLVPFHIQVTGSDVRLAPLDDIWCSCFRAVIACTNVANLVLARGIIREREIAIRMALGAGRLRIIRQMLTESAVLSLVAGQAGLLLATAGIKALTSLGSRDYASSADR
jgi:hypothetical protein